MGCSMRLGPSLFFVFYVDNPLLRRLSSESVKSRMRGLLPAPCSDFCLHPEQPQALCGYLRHRWHAWLSMLPQECLRRAGYVAGQEGLETAPRAGFGATKCARGAIRLFV